MAQPLLFVVFALLLVAINGGLAARVSIDVADDVVRHHPQLYGRRVAPADEST
jgi:hypothetical protein